MADSPTHAAFIPLRQWVKDCANGRSVAHDITPLVTATSALPLSRLEDWEKALRRELYPLSAPDSTVPRTVASEPLPAWLDLCHGSGFQRERALQRLSGAAPNRFFLALAVRRLNDWVPQVRAAAREALPLIAQATDPEWVVDVVCATLPVWSSWGRMERADTQALLAITAREKVAQALKCRLIASNAGPMTAILTQASRTPAQDAYLAEIASTALQPALRAKAYRYLLEGKTVWSEGKKWEWTDIRYCEGRFQPILIERSLSVSTPWLATLHAAAQDPSPRVRRVAGDLLLQAATRLGPEANTLAQQLAADVCPSVAERGIFVLKRLEKSA